MKLTLGLVQQLSGGEILRGDPSLELSDVGVDSRGTLPLNSLFVAIVGKRFDGHHFVNESMQRGAVAAVISRGEVHDYPDGALIRVDDTVEALQNLAGGWRSLFDIPVVAITGSNGKTIVKDILAAILGQENTVYRSPGSYNSQIGVALALLGLRAQHDIAIIEAGISQVGEMARLEKMIKPTAGILTNVGLAHAAGLSSLEITAREKLMLFQNLGERPLLYFGDDLTLSEMSLPTRAIPFFLSDDTTGCTLEQADAAYCIEAAEMGETGTTFCMNFSDGQSANFRMNIPGFHNLYNAAAALSAAAELGASVEAMREGLASFELSKLRLEMHTTPSGITLINDAYNSDPVSARAAINVLKHYAGGERSVAIVGDMLDLGERAQSAHQELGEVIARVGIERLICLGSLARVIGESAVKHGMNALHVSYIEHLDDLYDFLDTSLNPGDVVLFKASRNIGLERAATYLLESVAPTRLVIDLDVICDNFHAIRRQVGTRIMAVVKSFGYGNDATKVSQTLVQQGVDALAVAYPDEGIPLRQKGLSVPILVTNVFAAETDKIVKYDLSALIYSRDVAIALQRQAGRANKVVPVHLEVDTGMHRVGLKPGEVVGFARDVLTMPNLRIEGLMTHFAAADDPAEDDFTRSQMECIESVREALAQEGIAIELMHAANSAALWRFPEARFDMVRVGLALYGLHPSAAVQSCADETREALSFTTRVIHLHDIEAGQSVGYGRTYRAPSSRRLATIAAGYNDGLGRFMSNGGEVLIRGMRCPIVGNVCMDVAMVDVSELPAVEVGDEVVLFGTQEGEHLDVEEWATRGDTISYEVLCNISPRVRRIFLKT